MGTDKKKEKSEALRLMTSPAGRASIKPPHDTREPGDGRPYLYKNVKEKAGKRCCAIGHVLIFRLKIKRRDCVARFTF